MSDPSAKTLLTIATYNEIDNLPRLVDEIFDYLPQAEILVIDDNSPDGTGRWCEQRAADAKRLRCLHRPAKEGLGTATIAGLKYAVQHGYDIVVNLDADFSHHPRYLQRLIAGMDVDGGQPVDVVIGSRYAPGGKIVGWPCYRRLTSRGVNMFARFMLGLPVRDCSGSFRCYRVAALARLDFSRMRSRGYAYLEEILWRLKRRGAIMVETPITFTDRQRGQSKVHAGEAVEVLRVVLALFFEGLFSRRETRG